MGALDFLFEGKPPPSTTTYGTTTTDMPKWLSDYTQGLIGKANAIAAEPYQQYSGPRIAPTNADQTAGFNTVRQNAGAYIPGMQAAQTSANNAVTSAQPYFDKAGQTYPQAVSQYMDPYVSNVIDRGSQLAERTLNENFLPSVAKYFGASGASPRSTEYRATVDRGVRDLTEGLNTQNQAALSGAYQSGANTFEADTSRLGGLGTSIGNLNLNQAQTQAGLAETNQGLALRDAAAEGAIGDTQQQQTQKNLDLAQSDFAAQRDAPKNQVDWLSSVIRGTPTPTSTTTSQTGPASSVAPSPLSQLGSIVTGIGGIAKVFGARAGGRVMRKKTGGRVMKGGLAHCYA